MQLGTNLRIALDGYERAGELLKFVTRDQNRRVSTLIMEDQLDLLRNEYRKVIAQHKFDFFIITDAGGTVIVSMPNEPLEGYNYSRDVLIRHAMRGETNVSVEVLGEYELAKFGLLRQARVHGVQPTHGMLIRTSQPLINTNEIIVGTITAGYLLNNNNWLILDPITSGTDLVAGIFEEDVRIAANKAWTGDGVLAGRLRQDMRQGVLVKGEISTGRVNIGGRWFLAAYAPIMDFKNKPVGCLEIGIPEKVVFRLRDSLLAILCVAAAMSIVLSLIFGLRRGGLIVSSIRELRKGIESFGRGNLEYKVEVHSNDEIQELAEFYNRTIAQLKQTTKELELRSRDVVHLRHQVSESSAQLEAVHKQLLEYERMAAMGRMASVINHELRNIFAEVQTSAYYLKTVVKKDPGKAAEYVDHINKSITYANEVLSNVLRINYPKRVVFGETDINMLLRSLLDAENMKALFKKSAVKVVERIEPGLPSIKADGPQLREVVSILIVNGVQAMGAKGVLTVGARLDRQSIVVEVSDTGKGIPPNVLENLFTPFLTTKSRGLGLGLCIAKEIVKAHNGTIDVRTELNKGTVFTVRLPLTEHK
jgi:signal transduction histidine kinase